MVFLFAFQMVQNFQDESCFILSTLKGKARPTPFSCLRKWGLPAQWVPRETSGNILWGKGTHTLKACPGDVRTSEIGSKVSSEREIWPGSVCSINSVPE